MPWNAADLALASLRALEQAPRQSQPGAQGSFSPAAALPGRPHLRQGGGRACSGRETLSPKLVSRGSLAVLPPLFQRDEAGRWSVLGLLASPGVRKC